MFMHMKDCTDPNGHQWTDRPEPAPDPSFWVGDPGRRSPRTVAHFQGLSSVMVHCTICDEIGFKITEDAS